MTSPGQPDNTVRTEAKAAGGALVVSCAGAGVLPKVWRADLSHVTSAAFALEEAGGKISLVMKTPAATEEIFTFPDRASAALALKAVTQALFAEPHAQASSSSSAHAHPHKSGGLGRAAKIVFYCFLFFLGLSALVLFVKPRPADQLIKAATAPPQMKTGEPVPADELFGK